MCSFKRAEPTCNEPLILTARTVYGPEPPPRKPSSLPPPGNLTLHLKLGARIGRGRAGVVYEASVNLDDSSREITSMVAPPLVVKISRHRRYMDVEHEAFYYEEMECLQGVIVPRYYGVFRGSIPPGATLLPSENHDVDRREGEEDSSEEDSYSDDESEDQCAEDEDQRINASRLARKQRTVVDTDPSLVSILVLERVGGRLPIGKKLPNGTT